MAIITLFSGSYCYGDQIAEGIAKKLGYKIADQELLTKTAQTFKLSEKKLEKFLNGSVSFFGSISHERERALAYFNSSLAEMITQDNLILRGLPVHLLPLNLGHILKVCIIANLDYRIDVAVKTDNISRKEAQRRIQQSDSSKAEWTHVVRQHDPYDETMYDILLAMQSSSVEEAIDRICQGTQNIALLQTTESEQALKDYQLASRIHVILAEKGYDVEVQSQSGDVHVAINKYTSRLKQQQAKIHDLVKGVEGVQNISSGPGNRFTPPSLVPVPRLDVPSKVLLVDDEKEFVHTLSERLQTRDMNSSVVYDGEEALDFIANDEPEVMVLDLKMPGIDGIEVLRRVKRDYPNIEVIILTGHGSDKEEQIAMDLGAFAYLQKPVDINVLAQTMKDAYRKMGKENGTSMAE